MMLPRLTAMAAVLMALAACGGSDGESGSGAVGVTTPAPVPTPTPTPAPPPTAVVGVTSATVASFASPWAMVFLPDGRLLVSARNAQTGEAGRLSITTQAGVSASVAGLPANLGVLDVALHPQHATNNLVYFTFVEAGSAGTARVGAGAGDPSLSPMGLALGAATLVLEPGGGASLRDARVLWRQAPKLVSLPGSGEPGGRMAFSPDGRHLFVTAGVRQDYGPAQDLSTTLGKIIRLNADGSIPADNPFVSRTGALPEIWSLGHRNPYGLAFDATGRLWSHEQGPMGGDEVNLVIAGGNYGWPLASNGSHYGGGFIADHAPGDGYVSPATWWTPVIAPAGMIIYSGSVFAPWRGDAIITGLQSQGLVRVRFDERGGAAEMQRIPLGARIREVEQGPDGALWVLEDGTTARLLKLSPVF